MNIDRIERAAGNHNKGYNCAQAVACAFVDKVDMDEKSLFRVSEAFGFGMGDSYGTCGALSGAAIIIGLLNSSGNLDGPYSKADTYGIVRRISQLFREKNSTTICRKLKGMDNKKVLRSCDGCIEDVVSILSKIVKDV
ncbi:C-GCAxxG-C-C family protein [Pectinatus frisingensis]|uniref:C-GCAxxG-C-C family protein n=1 Tax=Pectinatus frisingensis TaxID=865 RepID=UPI0018C51B0C|nr:C-GCAxxG-C-C family protein [Pectinatus frisingensis]